MITRVTIAQDAVHEGVSGCRKDASIESGSLVPDQMVLTTSTGRPASWSSDAIWLSAIARMPMGRRCAQIVSSYLNGASAAVQRMPSPDNAKTGLENIDGAGGDFVRCVLGLRGRIETMGGS